MIQNVKLPLNGTELIEALVNDWGGFLREYQMALNELTSDFQIVDLEWKTKYGYSPIEHLKNRMKTPVSLIKKMQKRGLSFDRESIRANIHDIVGIRIVTSFIEDVYMLKEHIEQREDIRVIRVKDYIKEPKPSGYKSLHLVVETQIILSSGVIWVPAEIQIRTSAMDFWASTEHKLNYKYQGENVPDTDQKQLYNLAKAASLLDQEMSVLRNRLLERETLS
ncbi:GTP pyrophosphokinase YwaC [Paenibacillus larvae subsp. larvae]|uniref:GTP pyrophosphokinase YwaC n=1 Tax=Paenibacillus larvae subsp. larvae TaxID=147375 RepID=A0A2L1U0N8_9BACL|nr:GTP pyrophosphokinase family protein [Paenibacillus larvae]AQT83306.1 GTP pyrophosphokinase [Paenibacillus larvae subsp. pulvifaciens]AQZ48434.1 GTP pyrophosphokinase [Paenibacillus larvae subsp. pulvifaciens]AVF26438.1 GTP pyrophosphokinase YwaC [Paenibacillus larvae subsp. larvae]AVF31214.1 GTP pyrophosphokinase YwaC [Paenibacillus larvae subsp. larvae]MBH0344794.1 GTP pyrophosphokinase [Paenibacillus larvae]